jgi:AcrR family transcriptional regulator
MNNTKQKILDAAERLFGESGIDATSMRHIIAKAGVNLAAIHYHFGSKENLLLEVVMRRFQPVNRRRLELLGQAEADAAPLAAPLEKVLRAFLLPAVELAEMNPGFMKLMWRVHVEGFAAVIFRKHFKTLIIRFREALHRALPYLSGEELAWRSHFMIGAMASMLSMPTEMRPAAHGIHHENPRQVVDCLIVFLCGGFQAPASSAGMARKERK